MRNAAPFTNKVRRIEFSQALFTVKTPREHDGKSSLVKLNAAPVSIAVHPEILGKTRRPDAARQQDRSARVRVLPCLQLPATRSRCSPYRASKRDGSHPDRYRSWLRPTGWPMMRSERPRTTCLRARATDCSCCYTRLPLSEEVLARGLRCTDVVFHCS